MNNEPHKIGSGVRAWIFWGAPMFFYVVLGIPTYEPLARFVGEKIAPYIVIVFGGLITIITMIVDDYIPERLFIPIGVIGWALTFSFLYWYYCFGPGALKLH
jgi:hypothetical protein